MTKSQISIIKFQKLAKIELLLLDVDGVLTDGRIIYNGQGAETKEFNARDGLGIRLLMKAGITVAVVTGRASRALQHRCRDLGIHAVYDGVADKGALLEDIQKRFGLTTDSMAFVGDDLPDMGLMARVGLAIAVADADSRVRQRADWVTSAKGGNGAVREICEAILQAKGVWEDIVEGL
jgi:3-deoxy-D-manno-octulosonate 8-phosphate phosphatase (KDO 8-P phosphatase)